jgi:predicted nucleic acid-binding protein
LITAVDSSVLIDVLFADDRFGPRSAAAMRTAARSGAVISCDVVWAEIAGWRRDDDVIRQALVDLGVTYVPVSMEAAVVAGATWARYRAAGGSRDRLVPDFLIGAHALTQAEQLLTRDRGFYRRYFGDLTIVDPTSV